MLEFACTSYYGIPDALVRKSPCDFGPVTFFLLRVFLDTLRLPFGYATVSKGFHFVSVSRTVPLRARERGYAGRVGDELEEGPSLCTLPGMAASDGGRDGPRSHGAVPGYGRPRRSPLRATRDVDVEKRLGAHEHARAALVGPHRADALDRRHALPRRAQGLDERVGVARVDRE